MQKIQLTASDGHSLDAFIQENANSKGLVIVVQEIFGITQNILDTVERFAAAGYTAVAPAIYDRFEKDLVLEYSDTTKAREYKDALSTKNAMSDIRACIPLAKGQKVAVVGYCFGGTLAFLSACELGVEASICYYGGGIASMLDKTPKCPTLMHFGKLDSLIPLSSVEQIKQALPKEEIYIYEPAGHGFSCHQRESFHAPSDELAFTRSLDFLHKNLS